MARAEQFVRYVPEPDEAALLSRLSPSTITVELKMAYLPPSSLILAARNARTSSFAGGRPAPGRPRSTLGRTVVTMVAVGVTAVSSRGVLAPRQH